jgi:phosphatidylinositol glycan class M
MIKWFAFRILFSSLLFRAYLLIPNHLLSVLWGKILFILADILVAHLIYCILRLQLAVVTNQTDQTTLATTNSDKHTLIMKYVCCWLFNPYSMNVSTRGNSESIIALLVVLSLYLLYRGNLIGGSIL